MIRVTHGRARIGTGGANQASVSSGTSRPRPAVNVLGRAAEAAKYGQLEEAIRGARADGPVVAVLVPVLGRPHRVRPLVESFRAATSEIDARLYFVAQRSDGPELEAIRSAGLEPILVDDVDRSWAKKINRGMAATTEPWLLLGADDLAFRPGWIDSIRDLLGSHGGVIGTNDLGNAATVRGTSSTHPLVRRLYAQIFGTADEPGKVLHEGYDHNFPDSELVETAKCRGLYVHRRECVVEHLHPLWGKGTADPIYHMGQRNWHVDQALYHRRSQQFGF